MDLKELNEICDSVLFCDNCDNPCAYGDDFSETNYSVCINCKNYKKR